MNVFTDLDRFVVGLSIANINSYGIEHVEQKQLYGVLAAVRTLFASDALNGKILNKYW